MSWESRKAWEIFQNKSFPASSILLAFHMHQNNAGSFEQNATSSTISIFHKDEKPVNS